MLLLSDKEKTAFSRFTYSDTAVLPKEEYNLLLSRKLVKPSFNGSSWFTHSSGPVPEYGKVTLSKEGKEYKLYIQENKRLSKITSISFYDYTLLKLIDKKAPITRENLFNDLEGSEKARFDILRVNNLIASYEVITDTYGNKIDSDTFKVSDYGNACMKEYLTHLMWYWLPITLDTILSLVAIYFSLH